LTELKEAHISDACPMRRKRRRNRRSKLCRHEQPQSRQAAESSVGRHGGGLELARQRRLGRLAPARAHGTQRVICNSPHGSRSMRELANAMRVAPHQSGDDAFG
jgi:hypothetical protein